MTDIHNKPITPSTRKRSKARSFMCGGQIAAILDNAQWIERYAISIIGAKSTHQAELHAIIGLAGRIARRCKR